ncbi:hypothetical protein DEO72_LG1g2214 [Vigna unguiculata]|uniref:Uncharacterized protein n=1 Tax=Vigna unguiculata TaxID=3917 RepID=A0A4D6KLX3_VIGUN|nr:hypothetical protein DEO72_LG1g2214 [Vigna unguiculata]
MIIAKHKQIGDYPKVICCKTYRSQPIEHVREPLTQIIHCNARWSFQIRTYFVTSQDYQTRWLFTEEGNLSGPIHTGHNQHTHTGNTRQPELNSRVPRVHPPSRAQLEGCHSELNSRVPRVHPPSRAQLEGCHSELNSRNSAILPLKNP